MLYFSIVFKRIIFDSYCSNVQGPCKIKGGQLTISVMKSLQRSYDIFIPPPLLLLLSSPLLSDVCLGLEAQIGIYSVPLVPPWCSVPKFAGMCG